jgi:adenosylhomocysteinase
MSLADTLTEADFRVADLSLADFGRKEITLAEHEMPCPMSIRKEFAAARPLAGARITGSLHMTIQTAVLIETLTALGAKVRWCSCNIFSTQDHAAAAIAVGPSGTPEYPQGVPVYAWKGETLDEYWWCTEQVLRWPGENGTPEASGPNMILDDDGGDATLLVHKGTEYEAAGAVSDGAGGEAGGNPYSEEFQAADSLAGRGPTTLDEDQAGHQRRHRGDHDRCAPPLRDDPGRHSAIPGDQRQRLGDEVQSSTTSTAAGTRWSTASNRATDVMIAGKLAVICGFGDVGKGCAESLRGQGARVVVTEIDPICAMQAAMQGYAVRTLEDVIGEGDIFVTCTGNRPIIRAEHMAAMKHQAIVGNIGHFDNEIDIASLSKIAGIEKTNIKPQVDEWVFPDGHAIILLSEGRLLNLGNATGHPSFVMSNSLPTRRSRRSSSSPRTTSTRSASTCCPSTSTRRLRACISTRSGCASRSSARSRQPTSGAGTGPLQA